MLIGQIMTPNPITVTPETSHREAFEVLKANNISQVPVLDGGKLVGIVSERDLLSTQPSPATSLSIHEIYSLLERLKVRQFMSHPVYTVTEDCPVEAAARIMIDHKLGSIPIMRGEELVGIVSETDLFTTLAEVLGSGHEGMRFTVRVENLPGRLAEVAEAVHQSGGNIVSVITWAPGDKAQAELTIKEANADSEQLKARLETAHAELIDWREGGGCQLKRFGKA